MSIDDAKRFSESTRNSSPVNGSSLALVSGGGGFTTSMDKTSSLSVTSNNEPEPDASAASGAALEKMLSWTGFGWFQLRLCLLCGMGYLAVGAELTCLLVTQIAVKEYFNLSSMDIALSHFAPNLGSFLSVYFFGWLSDKIGRKFPFVLGLAVASVAGAFTGISNSYALFVFLRGLTGFGTGGISVVDFVVLTEVCSKDWRTKAVQLVFVCGCVGLAYVAALGMVDVDMVGRPNESWRSVFILAVIPLLITSFLRAFIATETPRYLAAKGQLKESYDLLLQMRVVNDSTFPKITQRPEGLQSASPPFSLEEYSASVHALTHSTSKRGNIKDVVKHARTIPLSICWFFQSLVYWGITSFLPKFLAKNGCNTEVSLFAMALSEIPGIGLATYIAMKRSPEYSLLVMFALSAGAIALTGVFSAIDEISSALVIFGCCLIYAFLVPIWGLLFDITPASYPSYIRASGVGLQHMVKGVPAIIGPFLSAKLSSMLPWVFMELWGVLLAVGATVGSVWLLKSARNGIGLEATMPRSIHNKKPTHK